MTGVGLTMRERSEWLAFTLSGLKEKLQRRRSCFQATAS